MARTEVKRDRIRGWVAESPKEGELQSDDCANQTRLQKQNSERCLGNIMRLAERSRSSQPRERSSLSSHGDYNSFCNLHEADRRWSRSAFTGDM